MKGGKMPNSGRKPTGVKPYKTICISMDLEKKIKELEPEGNTILKKVKKIVERGLNNGSKMD